MLLPFKKITYVTAVTITVISSLLLLFGLRQYLLHKHYQEVIERSERVIFEFSTIRAHIAEALLEGQALPIEKIIDEVEGLNSDISRIMGDILIPNEYKLSFINQVDLSGIVLLLRSLESGPRQREKLQKLYRETRLIGDRLQNFDRIIVHHAQGRLIGFQSVVIGALALVVFLVICMVLILHRQVVDPLIYFFHQLQEVHAGRRKRINLQQGCHEVKEMAQSYNTLLKTGEEKESLLSRYSGLITAVDKAGRVIDKADSVDDLYSGVCRALLSDEEYCLVWIGALEDDKEDLVPVAADASTTMSNRECRECMAVLLTDAEEKGPEHNPALLSLRKKGPVVLKDILAGLPKGLFRNTPLAEGYACCAAVPISWNGVIHGVLNVYSTSKNCFSELEVKLLHRLAGNIGKAIQQMQLKRQLKQLDQLSSQIVRSAHALVIRISKDGRILSFNREAEQITGFPKADVLQKDWLTTLLPPEEHELQSKVLKALVNSDDAETDVIIRIRCADKSTRILQCHLFKMEAVEGDGSDIVLVGQDITDRHNLEAKKNLLEVERNEIFTRSGQIIMVLGPDGTILDVNPAALRVTNMNRNKVVGKNVCALFHSDHPEHTPCPLQQAIESGRSRSLECKIGPEKREHFVTVYPITEERSGLKRILLIAEDVAEERLRKILAIRTCRLASIGELAAGIAHEINNPINGMINYAQIVLDMALEENRDPEEIKLIRRIIREGERIAQIVGRLLMFAKEQGQRKSLIDIRDVINESLALIEHQLKMDGIQVKINLPEDTPQIMANPQQLQQVFLNLFNNARQALNLKYPGKDPNKLMEIRGEVVRKNDKKSLKIYVVDRGVGIDPEVIDRIFEPFFSTKPPEEGTGLGLCISQQLIKDNAGHIHLESVLDEHTTVVVELPVPSKEKKLIGGQ